MQGAEIVSYFGQDNVALAVANYFATHGVTIEVRTQLESLSDEQFFDMVSDFIEGES